MKKLALLAISLLTAISYGQKKQPPVVDSERDGVEVRIKEIARFRGVRGNQLYGYGLVVGLEGTGDTKKTPFTSTLLANAMKDFGTMVDASQLNAKNIAVVAITAELPPFSTPGNTIDVTVQSIGDAKSLQGGTLLQAPLYGHASKEKAIAVAQGYVSIGGFNAGSAGNSVQKNHVNVGRIPSGGIVESAVPYQIVYDGKMFLELNDADITTAKRIEERLSQTNPEFSPHAIDGGTIELTLPEGMSPVSAMSEIESASVMADTQGTIVINERTGTIVVGGNVRLSPAVVAHGSLQVEVRKDLFVSQPPPLSKGETVVGEQTTLGTKEDKAKVALFAPNATVNDLAKIFQALKLTPRDIIAILQALKDQGAIKAKIKVQ